MSSRDDLSCETRQGRNVVKTWAETKKSPHPLAKDGYKFVFHTPKYRHGAHTMPIDTDMVAMLFGPFGDIYRHDKRTPFVAEGYVDINPDDAKELGVEDGDYVWIDSDPEDRPFRGWQKNAEGLRVRAPAVPGALLSRHAARRDAHVVQHVRRHAGLGRRAERRAPTAWPRTRAPNYQAMFRSGSHQSATRGWLKPTLDDRLAGAQGHVRPDASARASCPTCTARPARRASRSSRSPRPSRAASDGKGLWRPGRRWACGRGTRTDAMQRYLRGGFNLGGRREEGGKA